MNGNPLVVVDTAIELRLLGSEQPALHLPVSFRYTSSDPYAITLGFHGPDEDVEWVFARDLLRDGLTGRDGIGDVEVRLADDVARGPDAAIIALNSPDGRAELEADVDDLRAFLRNTEYLVAFGDEHQFVDLDAELGLLLAS